MTMKVFDLEDVNRNMISNEHYYKRTISAPPSQKFPFFFLCINPVVEWYWKCLVSPLLLRFAAGAAVLMSALIIWSEVSEFFDCSGAHAKLKTLFIYRTYIFPDHLLQRSPPTLHVRAVREPRQIQLQLPGHRNNLFHHNLLPLSLHVLHYI